MNKLIVFILICSTLIYAQNISSNNISSPGTSDTLKISALVEKQIQNAREKQSASLLPQNHRTAELIEVSEKKSVDPIEKVSGYSFLQNQSLQIQIFGMCSFVVILFVLIRRFAFILKRRSRNAIKAKIQMLREEKVTSSPIPKLQYSRRSLRNSELVLKGSDKHISRTAKDLKIAKGELLLAARLKLFEVGKM